jgi:hypothetical protein
MRGRIVLKVVVEGAFIGTLQRREEPPIIATLPSALGLMRLVALKETDNRSI